MGCPKNLKITGADFPQVGCTPKSFRDSKKDANQGKSPTGKTNT